VDTKRLVMLLVVGVVAWSATVGILLLIACPGDRGVVTSTSDLNYKTNTMVIDSCEYVVFRGTNIIGIAYNGNCIHCETMGQ